MSYHYGQSRFWKCSPACWFGELFHCAHSEFFQPLWVIIFIIVFDLLWLFRVVYFNLFVVISWMRYKSE